MTSSQAPGGDLVCFSHLRWDFVFQRPQHLLTRAARTRRVTYWEEPAWTEAGEPSLAIREAAGQAGAGIIIVQPLLPTHAWDDGGLAAQRPLLDRYLAEHRVLDPTLWYYTPRAVAFAGHLTGACIVYDCMDELSLFAEADPDLPALEAALLARADLVFTGGASLFEAKCRRHPAAYCFPSGVATEHFRPARGILPDPADQASLPHPRLGFYGVLDERLDRGLLAALCALRPGYQFILLGPTAKIEPGDLPQVPNLHWLGPKPYHALPAYLANWDVALMPFALNQSTRFISPTKTPEYLAAGRPVVSTPIKDVARAYDPACGVLVADGAASFAAACDQALALTPDTWRPAADRRLAAMGWDETWERMECLIGAVLRPPAAPRAGIERRAQRGEAHAAD